MFQKRDDIEQRAQDLFAPLARKYGWTELPVKHTGQITSCLYLLTHNRGLEVFLDFSDEHVDVYLVRLKNGKRPRYFAQTAQGERVRTPVWYVLTMILQVHETWLEELLLRLSVWNSRGYRGYEFADDILTAMALIVDRYLDVVQAQPEDVLFAPIQRASATLSATSQHPH